MAEKSGSGKMLADFPVAIIGAGPYGLALANYLTASGIPFIILGKPMELWRNHTFDSMNLRSDYATSEIEHPNHKYRFERFCIESGVLITDLAGQLSVSIFRQYIDWCFAQFSFAVKQQYVSSISTSAKGYQIETDQAESFTAQNVVLATGIAHHLHTPTAFRSHTGIVHSYHTREIQSLRDRKVLVVGSGQSAAESIAVLLDNNNQVEWYTRTDPVYFSEPLNLPKWLFNQIVRLPRFIRSLNPALIQRSLSLFSATTITPNLKSRVTTIPHHKNLPDLGSYDTIVTATGFRYSLSDLPFLSKSIKSGIRQRFNYPVVSKRFESSMPGLYFSGAITEPFFGPPMKFMIGARYSAAVLARTFQ